MNGQDKKKKVEQKDINEMVDEIVGYMGMIKRKLVGDDFSTLSAKFYNIETYEPEICPECDKKRSKFFFLLQPGDNLFENPGENKVISNYKLFCLECTKKINVVIPSTKKNDSE